MRDAGSWLLAVGVLVTTLLAGCATSSSAPDSTIRPPAPTAERLAAQLDLARGYLEQGDLARARPPLERALEIDRRSWEVHDLYARLYQREGELELAEESLKLALRLDRDNARVNNNYGIFLCQQARYRESVTYFEVATRDTNYPRRAQTFENMGICARLGEMHDVARNAFDRAVQINAQQPRALFELARYAFAEGDHAVADGYYRAFLTLAEQNAETLLFGARLAAALDDRDRRASYELALRNLYPDSPELKALEAMRR